MPLTLAEIGEFCQFVERAGSHGAVYMFAMRLLSAKPVQAALHIDCYTLQIHAVRLTTELDFQPDLMLSPVQAPRLGTGTNKDNSHGCPRASLRAA